MPIRVTITYKTTNPATRRPDEFAEIEGKDTATGESRTRWVSRWKHPDVDDYDAEIKRIEAEVRRGLGGA